MSSEKNNNGKDQPQVCPMCGSAPTRHGGRNAVQTLLTRWRFRYVNCLPGEPLREVKYEVAAQVGLGLGEIASAFAELMPDALLLRVEHGAPIELIRYRSGLDDRKIEER